MAVARKHHFFDYAAYRLRPADGTRTELVEGDFHVSPAPTLTHQFIVGELFRQFSAQLADAGVATVLMAPVDVILDEHNVVQPDLVVVSADRSAILADRGVEGAPDLVVEVMSEDKSYDRLYKRELYQRFGVSEYWLVDPKLRSVEVLVLSRKRFKSHSAVKSPGKARSPSFTGLEVALKPVFGRRF